MKFQMADDVFAALQERAVPLIDTPNDVLRRVLRMPPAGAVATPDTQPVANPQPTPASSVPAGINQGGRLRDPWKRPRPKRGETIPQSEYELPIVKVLQDAGGGAPTRSVHEGVREMLEHRFQPADIEELRPELPRWSSRVTFARQELVKQGLIDSDHHRGWWELTEQGKAADVSGVAAIIAKPLVTNGSTAVGPPQNTAVDSRTFGSAPPGRVAQTEERPCEIGEVVGSTPTLTADGDNGHPSGSPAVLTAPVSADAVTTVNGYPGQQS